MRDQRVDPRLPTNGTGEYEWKGFLAPSAHPQQINPPIGLLVNWNNSPAPGFGAADDNWSYGSIHRVQLLTDGLARAADARPRLGDVGDERGGDAGPARRRSSTPTLDRRCSPAARRRARAPQRCSRCWRPGARSGSSRLDRDLDGKMDAGAAPAIMDALYPKLDDAVLGPVLGPQLAAARAARGRDNGPRLRLHRRRDQLHRQGPAHAARRRSSSTPFHDALLRRRATWPRAGRAVAGVRGRRRRARRPRRAPRPGRLDVGRRRRADQVRARAC